VPPDGRIPLPPLPDDAPEATDPQEPARRFVRAGPSGSVPEQGVRSVWVQARKIALLKARGKLFACKDRCPHMGAFLSDGRAVGETVVCSWHGWTFDLASGQCVNKDWARVETYPVRVSDGEIEVGLPADP
jgi:nitrite reductase/ring-hydroxylating ferredoxin subunit